MASRTAGGQQVSQWTDHKHRCVTAEASAVAATAAAATYSWSGPAGPPEMAAVRSSRRG